MRWERWAEGGWGIRFRARYRSLLRRRTPLVVYGGDEAQPHPPPGGEQMYCAAQTRTAATQRPTGRLVTSPHTPCGAASRLRRPTAGAHELALIRNRGEAQRGARQQAPTHRVGPQHAIGDPPRGRAWSRGFATVGCGQPPNVTAGGPRREPPRTHVSAKRAHTRRGACVAARQAVATRSSARRHLREGGEVGSVS